MTSATAPRTNSVQRSKRTSHRDRLSAVETRLHSGGRTSSGSHSELMINPSAASQTVKLNPVKRLSVKARNANSAKGIAIRNAVRRYTKGSDPPDGCPRSASRHSPRNADHTRKLTAAKYNPAA